MRKLAQIGSIICLAMSGHTATSGELGVGVPIPNFGLAESAPNHPDSWPESPVDGFYYIDNSHDAATDAQNPFGSPNKPRLTLPEGGFAAGSFVELHGGPYGPGRAVQIQTRGTADAPVWIRGAASDQRTVIRRPIRLNGAYTIVENLHFDRSRTSIEIMAGSHHIAIRDSEFSGQGQNDGFTSVLGAYGQKDLVSHDIVFVRNVIRDLGDISDGAPENDYHGIKVSRYCENIWIARNHIYRMGGDSVQIGDARVPPAERCRKVFISQNEFYGNRENGVDIKSAEKIVVSGNIVRDFQPPVSPEAIGVVIHDGADSVWIIDNQIANNSIGIVNTYGTDTWIIGNTVVDSVSEAPLEPDSFYGGGVALHFRGDSTGGALLNTFANYQKGIQVAGGNEYLVAGNQFVEGGVDTLFDIMIKTTWLVDRVTFTHNSFDDFSARVSSSNFTRPSQLARQSRQELKESLRLSEQMLEVLCTPGGTGSVELPEAVLPERVRQRFRDDFGVSLASELFNQSSGTTPPAKPASICDR